METKIVISETDNQLSHVLRARWESFLVATTAIAEALVVVAIAGQLVLTFVGMCTRFFASRPILWTEEVGFISLHVVTFIGGALAVRRRMDMSLTFLVERLPNQVRRATETAALWAALGFAIIVLWTLPDYLRRSWILRTPVLRLPELTSTIWIALGFLLMTLYLIDRLSKMDRLPTIFGALSVCGCGVLVYVFRSLTNGGTTANPIIIMGFVAFVAFLAGVPIAVVLGLTGFAYILGTGAVQSSAIPSDFQSGISSFVLLTIPFFMLSGVLMVKGGLAARVVQMMLPLIGRVRGGLLIVQVVGVYLFSGVSGSKLADISAIGSVLREPIEEAGLDPRESSAVLAAAAAMSETVPPSLPIFTLASITSISAGALFVAGIIPAAVVAIVLIFGIVYRGHRTRMPKAQTAEFREFFRRVPGAVPALLLPVMLVAGIVGGVGTPTEVATFAAVYGVAVASFAYAKIRVKELWRTLADSATLAGTVLFILSTASLMSQMITIDNVPQDLTTWLSDLGGRAAFLALSVVILILFGSLLEGLPALLVFAPLLLPIATSFNINPIQYGIILIVAMAIGSFMPPVGMGFYVACAVGGSSVSSTMRISLFYNVALLIGLFALVLFPDITLLLPRFFGFG